MWHDDALKVNCTCVRVPIWRSHSESITIECENEVDVNEARELVSKAEGVLLKDDPKNQIYPMPKDTTNQDLVYVGRIRKEIIHYLYSAVETRFVKVLLQMQFKF